MSTAKPPHSPNRTILGMPSDVQAALEKSQTQPEDRRPPGQPSSAPAPAAKPDLQSTLYGNPHAQGSGTRPLAGAAQAPNQATEAQPSISGSGSAQRTIMGMPSDVEAALRQLQERAHPHASAPLTRSNSPADNLRRRSAAAPAASQAWPPADSAPAWPQQAAAPASSPPPRAASARPPAPQPPAAEAQPAAAAPQPLAASYGLPGEARFDPMTGKPLYPQPPREARFDPMTGKPLRPSQAIVVEASTGSFDPMTGEPLRASQAIAVEASTGSFDPMTGKPLRPSQSGSAQSSAGAYDPAQGKPLHPAQSSAVHAATGSFDPMTGKPLHPSQSVPVQPSAGTHDPTRGRSRRESQSVPVHPVSAALRDFDPTATVSSPPEAPREPARFDPAATVSARPPAAPARVEGRTVTTAPAEARRPPAQAPRFDPASTVSLRRPQVTASRPPPPPRSVEMRAESRGSRPLQTSGPGLSGASRQPPPLAKTAARFAAGESSTLAEAAAVSGEAAAARAAEVAARVPVGQGAKARAGTSRSGVHPSVDAPLASEPAAARAGRPPRLPLAAPEAAPRAGRRSGTAEAPAAGGGTRSTQAAPRATDMAPQAPAAKLPEPKSASEPVPVEPAKPAGTPVAEAKASAAPAPEPSSAAARSLLGGSPSKPAMDSTEPDRERSSPNAPASEKKSEVLRLGSDGPLLGAAQAGGMLATRLVPLEQEGAGSGGKLTGLKLGGADLPVTGSSTIEPLALNLNTPSQGSKPPVRRWPALALLGLAVVAFGGVIVVRAPGLLPPPVAAVVVPLVTPWIAQLAQLASQLQALRPSSGPKAPQPGVDPSQPEMPPGSALEAPSPPEAPPQAAVEAPQGPPAAQPAPPAAEAAPPAVEAAPPPQAAVVNVPAVQGGSAQLEKQAIEALIANDYRSAYALYERLRAAEPARPEYGVMLELLARELTPACGGPGQAACPAP